MYLFMVLTIPRAMRLNQLIKYLLECHPKPLNLEIIQARERFRWRPPWGYTGVLSGVKHQFLPRQNKFLAS